MQETMDQGYMVVSFDEYINSFKNEPAKEVELDLAMKSFDQDSFVSELSIDDLLNTLHAKVSAEFLDFTPSVFTVHFVVLVWIFDALESTMTEDHTIDLHSILFLMCLNERPIIQSLIEETDAVAWNTFLEIFQKMEQGAEDWDRKLRALAQALRCVERTSTGGDDE